MQYNKILMNQIVLALLLLGYNKILPAQQLIPLYQKNHVPNALPVSALYDSLIVKNPTDQRDTLVVVPRTLMPTLTVFAPAEQTKLNMAVIVCSGGGYFKVSDRIEGIPAAKQLAEAGITAFVLHYRVPRADLMTNKENVPIQDLQRAIQYVREHADAYQIDKNCIGVLGFSAGGHLVSTVCTHLNDIYIDNPASTSLRPDFMVLIYPVISFADSLTHIITRENLIGPNIDNVKIQEYSNELHVNTQTPPTFIVHSIDDNVVDVANSLYFAAALEEQNIPFKLYLYAKGGHGFGIYNPTSSKQWISPCIQWIINREWAGKR